VWFPFAGNISKSTIQVNIFLHSKVFCTLICWEGGDTLLPVGWCLSCCLKNVYIKNGKKIEGGGEMIKVLKA
jgi:hypothetical protein